MNWNFCTLLFQITNGSYYNFHWKAIVIIKRFCHCWRWRKYLISFFLSYFLRSFTRNLFSESLIVISCRTYVPISNDTPFKTECSHYKTDDLQFRKVTRQRLNLVIDNFARSAWAMPLLVKLADLYKTIDKVRRKIEKKMVDCRKQEENQINR